MCLICSVGPGHLEEDGAESGLGHGLQRRGYPLPQGAAAGLESFSVLAVEQPWMSASTIIVAINARLLRAG